MDRRIRFAITTIGIGLGVLSTAAGCRNLRAPEIPPEPTYNSGAGMNAPPIGFSSEPASARPSLGGMPDGGQGGMSYGADPAYATPPSASSYGNYAGSAYTPSVGGPATSADLPQPEPLQSLPESTLTDPLTQPGMPGGY